jgi:hypothetical protein
MPASRQAGPDSPKNTDINFLKKENKKGKQQTESHLA